MSLQNEADTALDTATTTPYFRVPQKALCAPRPAMFGSGDGAGGYDGWGPDGYGRCSGASRKSCVGGIEGIAGIAGSCGTESASIGDEYGVAYDARVVLLRLAIGEK